MQTTVLHGNFMQKIDRNAVSLGNLLQKLEICKPQVYRVQRSDHRLD